MKIVVLDGYTLNPGDLDWQPLRELGECVIYDRTTREEILSRSLGATALLTNKVPLRKDLFSQLPDLRYIGVIATGHNIVDAAEAAVAGITVTNVPSYGTPSVVQLVFAHLLNLANQFTHLTTEVGRGRWAKGLDFSFWDAPMIECAGKRMGIVGFGRIGKDVAKVALSLGMEVVVNNGPRSGVVPRGIREVSLEELFRLSDVVSLHCPLTPATAGLVNEGRLAMMKPTAFLINTGRGELIDERALASALGAGRIAGAGLDVLSSEPPPPDHPLLHARNCTVTPHVAWATVEARRRLMTEITDNLRAFLNGDRRNVVG
jgi:glycerate dehydrogenase